MVETLADRTARLMRARAKDATHAPAARFGRAADNPTLEADVVRGATAMPRAFAEKAVRPTVIESSAKPPPVEKLKDPEQMKLRPAGYEPAGHSPQIGPMPPGTMTSQTAAIRSKFKIVPLNKDHAQAAHDAAPKPLVTPPISGSVADRIKTVTNSDMRPIGRFASAGRDEDGGRGD